MMSPLDRLPPISLFGWLSGSGYVSVASHVSLSRTSLSSAPRPAQFPTPPTYTLIYTCIYINLHPPVHLPRLDLRTPSAPSRPDVADPLTLPLPLLSIARCVLPTCPSARRGPVPIYTHIYCMYMRSYHLYYL